MQIMSFTGPTLYGLSEAGLMGGLNLGFVQALVFASFIVAVDPVAVRYQIHLNWTFIVHYKRIHYKVNNCIVQFYYVGKIDFISGTLTILQFPTPYCLDNFSILFQVLAIFQEVGVNNMLYFLVFGESLLNGEYCHLISLIVCFLWMIKYY